MVRLMPMALAMTASDRPACRSWPILMASGMSSSRRASSFSRATLSQMMDSMDGAGSSRASSGVKTKPLLAIVAQSREIVSPARRNSQTQQSPSHSQNLSFGHTHQRLVGELDPVYLEYCEALIKGIPEREIAKSMGVSQTTFNYRKLRLLDYLRSRLDNTEDRKQNHIAPPNTHRVKAEVSAMMSVEVLDELAGADITEQSRDTLVDISKITIRGDSPQQRLASYMEQVKNPYCFKVGNIPVKISFSDDGPTLEDTLTRFFKSIKKQRQV